MNKREQGQRNQRLGAEWEFEVAQRLRKFFPDARVKVQTRGAGRDAPDVAAGPFAIECKHSAHMKWTKALGQAEASCELPGYIVTVPMVAHRCPTTGRETVVMTFEAFESLLTEARTGGLE